MELIWSEGAAGDLERQWGALRKQEGESLGRALTMNLICRAHEAADAERMAECLWKLGPQHPARVFVIVPGAGNGAPRLRVAAHGRGSEMVWVEIGPERAASWVAPLLATDLPVVLWWHGGRPNADAEFAGWTRLSDRVLVDAHRMRLSASHLAALAGEMRPHAHLTDLTWSRLTPWRQLLCQGLETEPDGIHRITRVTLTTGGSGTGPASGNLAALLIAGWMAELLQWTPQARLGAQTLRLQRGWETPVTLRFEADTAPHPPLLRRLLVEGEENSMAVEIEYQHGRHAAAHLAMTVRRAGTVVGEWAGAAQAAAPGSEAPLRSEAETLCEEFSIHGGDALYQQSLERGLAMLAHLTPPFEAPAA